MLLPLLLQTPLLMLLLLLLLRRLMMQLLRHARQLLSVCMFHIVSLASGQP